MTNILVTGSKGQLGSEIKELSKNYPNIHFVFTDIEELDITSFADIENFVAGKKFSYLINCAAYTNVDGAEENKEMAELLNAEATKNLATISKQNNIIPIHISTDYVFSGKGFKPYSEEEQTEPQSVYGDTKLKGENYLQEICPNHITIRTSWLYSPFGKNFLKTMLNLGKERDELQVVTDQVGTPTYAYDLASCIMQIIERLEKDNLFEDFGIYHYSNEGICSWFDFATEIQIVANNNCKINSTDSESFKTLAKRPHYSVLNKSKIKHIFELDIPHWRGRISHCINRIKS
ncbi:dTDP-4-dehydrorhamnose reductase [Marinifilum flexuosum]|uniref:dTDP-4-dehydrorhamnose reductase n=1 Tax=Marinifilum flexuosum TaxID=1117708 RepID=A0A419X438_9BACT|nr:dTDP-4-dehydrorhamnose reductase [Marinifilum flexuosum]RKE02526.1 dTDP-4-dehydrorhamnose reductase [Marinifilum flexuosum]